MIHSYFHHHVYGLLESLQQIKKPKKQHKKNVEIKKKKQQKKNLQKEIEKKTQVNAYAALKILRKEEKKKKKKAAIRKKTKKDAKKAH